MWNFSAAPPQAAESGRPPAKPDGPGDPSKVEKMFAELDKFCAAILAIPEAAANQDVMKQIAFIKDSKEKLKLAQVEQAALDKATALKMEAFVREAEEKKEAHRRKMEKLTTPSPPLDGNALGQALLKSLGLIVWPPSGPASRRGNRARATATTTAESPSTSSGTRTCVPARR